ncbi:unnamed protein product [Rotaria magnacalcarata]
MNWKLHVNIFLYIIGSCLFIIGSILFHPHFSKTDSLYKTGVLTFTFGSILFGLGSLQQLLANFRSISSNNNELLINEAKPFYMDLAISICRNTIGSVNGFLFTIGSVAFWPTYGHCGSLVGNWMYRCGAFLGVVNSMWQLIRLQMKSTAMTTMKLLALLSLLGSIAFLVGGGYFLIGGKHDIEGSFVWLAGSVTFLLSSILTYKL